jgi:hypothetical protein
MVKKQALQLARSIAYINGSMRQDIWQERRGEEHQFEV